MKLSKTEQKSMSSAIFPGVGSAPLSPFTLSLYPRCKTVTLHYAETHSASQDSDTWFLQLPSNTTVVTKQTSTQTSPAQRPKIDGKEQANTPKQYMHAEPQQSFAGRISASSRFVL